MIFGTRYTIRQLEEIRVQCDDAEIEIVNKLKYLRAVLDTNLTFAEHVNYLKSKLIGRMNV